MSEPSIQHLFDVLSRADSVISESDGADEHCEIIGQLRGLRDFVGDCVMTAGEVTFRGQEACFLATLTPAQADYASDYRSWWLTGGQEPRVPQELTALQAQHIALTLQRLHPRPGSTPAPPHEDDRLFICPTCGDTMLHWQAEGHQQRHTEVA